MMPRMSGYEVCHKIRENTCSSELPVIMVTPRTREDLVQGFHWAPTTTCKPFRSRGIFTRIQTHIDLHRFDVTVMGALSPNEFSAHYRQRIFTGSRNWGFAEREVTVLFSDIRDYTTLSRV